MTGQEFHIKIHPNPKYLGDLLWALIRWLPLIKMTVRSYDIFPLQPYQRWLPAMWLPEDGSKPLLATSQNGITPQYSFKMT